MKPLETCRRGSALAALIIAVIVLGAGALAWEWHSAHPASRKHDKAGSLTHHHSRQATVLSSATRPGP